MAQEDWDALSNSARNWAIARGLGPEDVGAFGLLIRFNESGEGMRMINTSRLDRVDRETIGGYFHTVGEYLAGRAPGSEVERYRGISVAGMEFETDLETLEAQYFAGDISFESLYET